MKYLWQLTINDYIEIIKRAKALGIKEGESMEEVFHAYAEEKGLKPIGATELTIDELKKEMESHGKRVLTKKDFNDKSK